MRSKSADTGKLITVGFYVPDGASGAGVAAEGITWRMARTATGTYVYRLSRGLRVISVVGTSHATGYFFVEAHSIAEEYFIVNTIGHTGVLGNLPHSLVVTALDNRP